VRGACNNCKTPYLLGPDDIYYDLVRKNLPNLAPDQLNFYKGKGCPQCNGTGYAKRLALHEVLLLDQTIRTLICQNVAAGEIREAAIKAGMRTLLQDGLIKALNGATTVEEVVRVTYTTE
jgi:type II secretory ATPase GspE/PulE/Tfp pilus assembly ATPase PilB-like protein